MYVLTQRRKFLGVVLLKLKLTYKISPLLTLYAENFILLLVELCSLLTGHCNCLALLQQRAGTS